MTLQRHFENSGNWLFRWRSFLPFLLFLLFVPALPYIRRPLENEVYQNIWEIICFLVSFSGLMLRCAVVGYAPPRTSGRNTHAQVAESLNATGIYSVVRHPLYVGNFLIWLGIAMFSFVPWLVLSFCLIFWLYYERIMFAEEAFLRQKFGSDFEKWASTTPAFFPKFSNYRPASHPFSLKKALRKECSTFLGIGLAFAGMDQFENLIVERNFSLEPHWLILGAAAVLAYFAMRCFKSRLKTSVE